MITLYWSKHYLECLHCWIIQIFREKIYLTVKTSSGNFSILFWIVKNLHVLSSIWGSLQVSEGLLVVLFCACKFKFTNMCLESSVYARCHRCVGIYVSWNWNLVPERMHYSAADSYSLWQCYSQRHSQLIKPIKTCSLLADTLQDYKFHIVYFMCIGE